MGPDRIHPRVARNTSIRGWLEHEHPRVAGTYAAMAQAEHGPLAEDQNADPAEGAPDAGRRWVEMRTPAVSSVWYRSVAEW